MTQTIKRSTEEKLFILFFIPTVLIMYLVYKYPLLFVTDVHDLYLLGKKPSFWYGTVYTAFVCGISGLVVLRSISPYKKQGGSKALSSYQRNKFISIFFVQLILFWILPYLKPGLQQESGFWHDTKEITIYAPQQKSILGDFVYQATNNATAPEKSSPQYLFAPTSPEQSSVGVISEINGDHLLITLTPEVNKNAYVYIYNGFTSLGGFLYLFILVPIIVWFFGKRYCSWFCACGNLAETIGVTKWGSRWVRNGTPRSDKAYKLETMQYVFVIWGIIFGLILFVDTWKLFTVGNLPTFMRQFQDVIVDLMFGALIGVGAYPFFGTRLWCRYGCPLAGTMRLVGKFTKSRYRITANIKCTGIGECTNVCPMGIDVASYAHKNGKPIEKSFGLESTTCIGCGGCVDICPMDALSFGPADSTPATNKGDA